MANNTTRVTVKEALRYNKQALIDEIDKIEANIKIFEDTIAQEKLRIDRNQQMINILEISEQSKNK
jgi:hypothetical protein